MSENNIPPTYGYLTFCSCSGGNHVGWLLFLDDCFEDTIGGNTTANSKIDTIAENIYRSEKTWNTWLSHEWRYRKRLDKTLCITHNVPLEDPPDSKILFLTLDDFEKAITHYYHINLSLNCNTPQNCRYLIKEWHENIQNYCFDGITRKAIISDCIYDPVLNYEWYKSIVDFFGFDDNYEYAKQVHEIYYQLRKKSARDFCEYFSSDEFQKYKQMMYEFGHQ